MKLRDASAFINDIDRREMAHALWEAVLSRDPRQTVMAIFGDIWSESTYSAVESLLRPAR
jgi:hypothetical protein